jgi:opacity protein-like surface antigen
VLAFSLAALAVQPAYAQFSMQRDPTTPFKWRGHVEGGFSSTFKTDTRGGDSFDSWTSSIHGDFGGPINQSILMGIEAGYQYSHYDFQLDGARVRPAAYGSRVLPRNPWGAINTLDISPTITVLIGDHLSFDAAVPIRYSGETGAHSNGFTAGASGLFRWQISEDIRIGAGIGVVSKLEGSSETFPIVAVDWALTNSLTLRTEGNWSQGGRASILWGPNEAIRATLSAGYERNRFRLDDNGSARDKNGVGEITSVPVEVGLRIRLYEDAYFNFRVGVGFAGRLRVEDSRGGKLYNEPFDPVPRIGATLSLPFRLPRQLRFDSQAND